MTPFDDGQMGSHGRSAAGRSMCPSMDNSGFVDSYLHGGVDGSLGEGREASASGSFSKREHPWRCLF